MTDKEMLELAAKAAGIEYTVNDAEYYKTHKFFGLWLVLHGEPYEGQRRYCNPLHDDGDALRLAVKLGMKVTHYIEHFTIDAEVYTSDHQYFSARETYTDDPYAATRRAIVRAAAEIGKAMP